LYTAPPKDMEYTRKNVNGFREPQLSHRREEVKSVLRYISEIDSDKDAPQPFRHVDKSRTWLAGHSFGGCSTIFCQNDDYIASKLVGCILLDVWSYPLNKSMSQSGLRLPTLSILTEQFATNPEAPITKRVFAASTAPVESFYIKGTVHMQMSDAPFLFKSRLSKVTQTTGKLSREVSQDIMIDTVVDFFKLHHEKGQNSDTWKHEIISRHRDKLIPFPYDIPQEKERPNELSRI